jgi:uncharacterized damage-inducible protein DinB
MNVDYIQMLQNYHYDRYRQIWDCIMHLTDEQFVQAIDYSIGSVRNHMLHLVEGHARWFARIQGQPLPDYSDPEGFSTRESMRSLWDSAETEVMRYIEGLNEEELARSVSYDMPHRGGAHANTVWQILVHLINHGTDHRSQILRLLYDFGAPTMEHDLMLYLWDRES